MGLSFVGFTSLAHAQSFKSGDMVAVPAGQTLNRTLYSAGKTLDIAGTVDGDVFCGGQTVTISGTVKGDVVCAAQAITISGTVEGNIRIAGQTVTVNGTVGRNASIAAQTYMSDSKSRIAGDMGLAAETATLNGSVGRDVAYAGDTLTIAGSVGRDLTGTMQHLLLNSSARVAGGGSYTSPQKAQIADGAVVAGNLTYHTPKPEQHKGPAWGVRLYFFIATLLASLALVLLVPRVLQRSSQFAIDRPGKTVLTGLLASIVVPVALVALLFTFVGIPLALFLGIVWFVVCCLSGSFAAYYFGRLLLRGTRYKNAVLYMLLGSSIVMIAMYLPLIGFVTTLAMIWFGLGMIVMWLQDRYKRPGYTVSES
ncbi:MAG TPA: polymer-forming cytoskeletal protein [Candidatus Saccharimonadales bacterium]|nr:polymer-forming cytoskeletal protein [Candidatus Saccharimonadales bacterium]